MASASKPASHKRYTARNTYQGAVPPAAVLIEDFVAERAHDAGKLVESLDREGIVPKHLRRRARSWRPFGLLRRRPPVMADARVVRRKRNRYRSITTTNDSAAVLAAEKEPGTGNVRVRVRKHWRRPAILLKAHASWVPPLAGTSQKYLQTHIWHAKRAHMENLWNHRLATRNCGLGVRALYRGISRHCCMHDRSYMQLIEIFGSEDSIVHTLNRCGVHKRLALSASARSGSRRFRSMLYACDTAQLVAPVLILWCPSSCSKPRETQEPSSEEEMLPFVVDVGQDNAPQPDINMSIDEDSKQDQVEGCKIWVWVHPSAADEALSNLSLAAQQAAGTPSGSKSGTPALEFSSRPSVTAMPGLGFLELSGPKALEVLARVIPAEVCRDSAATRLWRQVSSACGGARVVPPHGAVLAIQLEESFLNQCKTPGRAAGRQHNQGDHGSEWLARWPEQVQQCHLWETVSMEDGLDVLLVFRGGGRIADCAAGVDVILPAGACHKLWLRCYFAGCRAIGVRDRHSLLSDAALPEFPFDFPDTQAGQQQSAQEGSESRARFQRRPPAKRPNFELLGIHSPHLLDWGILAAKDDQQRPQVCRTSQLVLLSQPRSCFSHPGLLPVTVRSAGRGMPRGKCHLYRPSAEDLNRVKAPGIGNSGGHGRGESRTMRLPSRDHPPSLGPLEVLRLEEQRHTVYRLRRRRVEGAETRKAEVAAIRPLVGFVTSGSFSYRHGCGAGVGAVVAGVLGDLVQQAGAAGDVPRWMWLWARNTTSLVYFPVWVQCLPDDQGFG